MYDTLLKGKAKEVSSALEEWVVEKRILGPGERIVFSLRIERTAQVQREICETENTRPHELTIVRGHYSRSRIVPVAPAVCDERTTQEIISLFSYEEYRKLLQSLLIFNGNGNNVPILIPLDGGDGRSAGGRMNSHYEGINKTLIENPIRGVYYRLVRQSAPGKIRQHYYQLFCAEKRESW